MAINKEMVKSIWFYVVKPQLDKLAKNTRNPIDDFIVKTLDNAIKEFIAQK